MIIFLLLIAQILTASVLSAAALGFAEAWVASSSLVALSCLVYRLARREPLGLPSFNLSFSQQYYDCDDEERRRYYGINPSTGLAMYNPSTDIGGNGFGVDMHINRD